MATDGPPSPAPKQSEDGRPRLLFAYPRATRLGTLVGLSAALIVGALLLPELEGLRDKSRERWEPVKVAIVARNVTAGQRLAGDDVDFRIVPRGLVTGSFVLWEYVSMLAGQPSVASVGRGELLRFADFNPGLGAPSADLTAGTVGLNVDARQLKDVRPGDRVRLARRTAEGEAVLFASARVVAFDGTTGPEPGRDEARDDDFVALVELPPEVAPDVAIADADGTLVLTRAEQASQVTPEAPAEGGRE